MPGQERLSKELFKKTAELYQENRDIRRGVGGSGRLYGWRGNQKMNSTGESFRQTQNSTREKKSPNISANSQKFEIN